MLGKPTWDNAPSQRLGRHGQTGSTRYLIEITHVFLEIIFRDKFDGCIYFLMLVDESPVLTKSAKASVAMMCISIVLVFLLCFGFSWRRRDGESQTVMCLWFHLSDNHISSNHRVQFL